MKPELILVVCAANVCRSPLAELLMRRGLQEVEGLRVASAGTLVRNEAAICARVKQFRDDESWAEMATAHRSRPALAGLLEQAALILVSSRDVRADVVLAAPTVRDRTYTLREAAHLGADFDLSSPPRHVGVVSRYAVHLDRARVVTGPVRSVRRHWTSTRSAAVVDIPDGHGRNRWVHSAALNDVRVSVATVVRQLSGHPD